MKAFLTCVLVIRGFIVWCLMVCCWLMEEAFRAFMGFYLSDPTWDTEPYEPKEMSPLPSLRQTVREHVQSFNRKV